LFSETKQTGRHFYTASDAGNENLWGKLQYAARIAVDEDGQATANALLEHYNKTQRTLSVSGVHGHPQVRAGCSLMVSPELSGNPLGNPCVIERAIHRWAHGRYSMDLELRMIRGGNPTGKLARLLGWNDWADISTMTVKSGVAVVLNSIPGISNSREVARLSEGTRVSYNGYAIVNNVIWINITFGTRGETGFVISAVLEPVSGGGAVASVDQIRYVTSNGLRVRSSAGGTVVTTMKDGMINRGSLLIVDTNTAPVTKRIDGSAATSQIYTWDRVSYFQLEDDDNPIPDVKRSGWVAREMTDEVPRSVTSKSQVIRPLNTELRYDRQSDMLTNARYIHNYLRSKGWSHNAIYAMLGNMEQESNINPNMWQKNSQTNQFMTNNMNAGYGLVQWTPASKYIDKLPNGAQRDDIDRQLQRIVEEVETNIDTAWQAFRHTPQMTFSEFTKSNDKSVEVLAEYFLRCYERPQNVAEKVTTRQNHAKKWRDVISKLL